VRFADFSAKPHLVVSALARSRSEQRSIAEFSLKLGAALLAPDVQDLHWV